MNTTRPTTRVKKNYRHRGKKPAIGNMITHVNVHDMAPPKRQTAGGSRPSADPRYGSGPDEY